MGEVSGQGGKLFCVDAPESMLEGSVEIAGSSAADVTTMAQCVEEFKSCGGPGLADQPCCSGMQCVRSFVGTDKKQCVATTTTSPQCVKKKLYSFGTLCSTLRRLAAGSVQARWANKRRRRGPS